MDTQPTSTPLPVTQISPLDEARLLRDETKKLAETLTAERQRLELLNANAQVAGRTTGVAQPPQQPVRLSDSEYATLVKQGKANPLKDDGYLK